VHPSPIAVSRRLSVERQQSIQTCPSKGTRESGRIARPERRTLAKTSEGGKDGRNTVSRRNGSRKSAVGRLANPCRGDLHAHPDVRWLRCRLDRLGCTIVDPCLGYCAVGLCAGLLVVEPWRHGRCPIVGAAWRPVWTEAGADGERRDLRAGV